MPSDEIKVEGESSPTYLTVEDEEVICEMGKFLTELFGEEVKVNFIQIRDKSNENNA